MITEREIKVLSHLRQNAKKKLSEISKETGIPLSTVFETLKTLEINHIKQYSSILMHENTQFQVRMLFALRSDKSKEELKDFITTNPNVNSIFRTNNGYHFLIEAVFKNMAEAKDFSEKLDDFKLTKKNEHHIIEDIFLERFLSCQEHYNLQLNTSSNN